MSNKSSIWSGKFFIFNNQLLNGNKIIKVSKEDTNNGCHISIRTVANGDSYLAESIEGREECSRRWHQLRAILNVSG